MTVTAVCNFHINYDFSTTFWFSSWGPVEGIQTERQTDGRAKHAYNGLKLEPHNTDAVAYLGFGKGGPWRARGARAYNGSCLLYTSPSPRDRQKYRMPSSA